MTALTTDLVVRYGFQVLGAIVIAVIGLLAGRWAADFTQRSLERRALDPPVRWLMVRTVKILVLALTLVVVLDKLGFQVAPLVAGIGVAGVGLGFALQGVLGNVVAGLSIILTKPFRVGEYIEILGTHGEVATIELVSTTLVHADRSRVIIPNRKIVGEILHNFGTVRQIDLAFGVAYGADLNDVLGIAHDVIAKNPRVLREPAPNVGVATLTDSAIKISVQPWVAVSDYGAARSEINQAIVEQLRTMKIALPEPTTVRVMNSA